MCLEGKRDGFTIQKHIHVLLHRETYLKPFWKKAIQHGSYLPLKFFISLFVSDRNSVGILSNILQMPQKYLNNFFFFQSGNRKKGIAIGIKYTSNWKSQWTLGQLKGTHLKLLMWLMILLNYFKNVSPQSRTDDSISKEIWESYKNY